MQNIKEFSENYFKELDIAISQIDKEKIAKIAEIIFDAYKNDKQIFIFGNGGSASTASHFACDLAKGTVKDFNNMREKRFKAVSLSDNVALMTAIGNDLSYEDIFWQQLSGLVQEGDIVIGISASGNSANVVKAIQKSKECGAKTIGLLGFKTGGKLHNLVDYEITVQDNSYGRVEDIHLILTHIIANYLGELKNRKVNKKKILVTGNKGYIGSVLTEILLNKGYDVAGLDTGFYNGCQLYNSDYIFKQIKKDIREIAESDLLGFDAIIHLAALSNDPLGQFDPTLTEEINFKATVSLAQLAKKAGVKRFIYSSSQSMYGVSNTENELDEDAEKNPVTAYAKTKWDAECELKKIGDDNFIVVCFRPSTVFGASPNLRCDIVFNNLVASAYTTGKIEIKSDGTPWRPVVHVKDVCQAYIAGLEAPENLVRNQSFNVGVENGNYTVKDLAEAAQRSVLGSQLVFTGEHGSDSRTYKVSFNKILTVLKDYYKPEWNLDKGGKELVDLFNKVNFTEEMFRGRQCNRLPQLKYLIENQKIDNNLSWKK